MFNVKEAVLQGIAKASYKEAKRNINSLCVFWSHQPEVPRNVDMFFKQNKDSVTKNH